MFKFNWLLCFGCKNSFSTRRWAHALNKSFVWRQLVPDKNVILSKNKLIHSFLPFNLLILEVKKIFQWCSRTDRDYQVLRFGCRWWRPQTSIAFYTSIKTLIDAEETNNDFWYWFQFYELFTVDDEPQFDLGVRKYLSRFVVVTANDRKFEYKAIIYVSHSSACVILNTFTIISEIISLQWLPLSLRSFLTFNKRISENEEKYLLRNSSDKNT